MKQVTNIDAQSQTKAVNDLYLTVQDYTQIYDRPPEYEISGTLEIGLPEIHPGDRFGPLSIEVAGVPYSGKLKNWSGVSVQKNSQRLSNAGAWESASTGEQGFILDLGGMWPVLELSIDNLSVVITCVLPWLGTDFAPASVYPAHSGSTPNRTPDPTGTTRAALRGVESKKLYVQLSGGIAVNELLENLFVASGVYPRSLRARVDSGDVFWTHPNELRGESVVTGLHESLNALARDLETKLTPTLVLESDAPGVILAPPNLSEELVAEKGTQATWAGAPETTVEIRAGERLALPLIFTDDESGKTWAGRSLRVEGRYEASPWRMEALQTGELPAAPMALTVDAHFAAAHRFTVDRDLELFGLSVPLASEEQSSLLLEIHCDVDGQPAGEALAATDLSPAAAPRGAWQEALFPEPLSLEQDGSFWVLLKAREGAARWLAVAEEISDSRTSEEGGSWSAFPAVYRDGGGAARLPQAMLRLLRRPYPEESEDLLKISLPGRNSTLVLSWNRQMEDEALEWDFAEADLPELSPPGSDAGRTWDATLLSQAGGTLELDQVELFYELRP